ncbi:MAG: transposase [Patescibacteria group bacterium]|nr:transposase [Patescibacteria group bacterium]
MNEKYADIVLNSLKYLRANRYMLLFCFIIMPDHVHVFIKPRGKYDIHKVTSKFCSYTGHAFLRQMEKNGEVRLLTKFRTTVFSKKQDRRYHFWRDSLAKNIFSYRALWRVMEYIHSNPCNKKWHLVDDRADYKYSSACFYDRDEKPIIEIDDVRNWVF